MKALYRKNLKNRLLNLAKFPIINNRKSLIQAHLRSLWSSILGSFRSSRKTNFSGSFGIFLLLVPFALHAQETPSPSVPAEQSVLSHSGVRSTILIEAKGRSDDIVKAYDLLKKEKPTLRISAHTYSGAPLSNIIEIIAMPNGTLLLFRISSTQGVKNVFVSVDDVIDLFYS